MRHTTIPLLSVVAVVGLCAAPSFASWQAGEDEALESRSFAERGDRPSTAPSALRAESVAAAEEARARQAQPEAPEADRDLDPVAVELLEAVAEALSVGFSAETRSYAAGSDFLASAFPKSEGRWAQAAFDPEAEALEWAVRYTGQGTVMTKPEPIDFDVLWQTDRVSWVDHVNKVYFVQRLQGTKSGEAYQIASSAFGQVQDMAMGFAVALGEAAEIAMAPGADIEGVACDAVSIRAEAGGDAVIWYFGREDRLPRRSEIVLPENELMSGSLRVDFTEPLSGDGAVAADDFRMFAPDGYDERIASTFRAGDAPASTPATTRPEPVQANAEGGWSINDTEGNTLTAADLTGRVTVLYFWGTWSTACDKATPALAELAAEFEGQPVAFHGLAFREGDPGSVGAAALEQGHAWPVYAEADEAVGAMGIRRAPSFMVLGPQGELLLRTGRPRGDDYAGLITQLRGVITRALENGGDAEGEAESSRGEAQSVGPARAAGVRSATPIRAPKIKKKDE